MKKTFTILIAAIAAILMMAMPKMVWGQEKTDSTAGISNANIVAAGDAADSYKSWSVTGSNSKTWNAYAIKKAHSGATSSYHYLQIKKYASSTAYYIQIPAYGAKINSITMTVSSSSKPMGDGGNTATLFFSSSNSTSSTGTGVASGTGDSSVTIDCSSLNLNTGYITASAGVRIWDVEISYTPYTITYSATNGSISGVLNGTNPAINIASGGGVVIGDQVTLTATPSSGYSFNGWSVSGTGSTLSSASANPTTFTMGTANATVTANFVSGQAYTITALSNNNNYGTVALNGNVITANPAAGYTYANQAYTITSGSATVEQNGNEFTVTPTTDCTVTINFAAIPTHTATFSVNGNTTSNTFYEGQTITFPSNPAAINGKSFVGWYTAEYTHANTAPSFVNTTTATMGNSNITYYAVFAIVTTTYSETETETLQTHKYDTWTYSGTTTDMTSYRLFAENAYIESSSFDFSILKQVNVYAGTYGTLDNDKKKVTVVAGTTTWGTASLSTNSATTKNEITSSVSLSGNGQLHFVAGGGNGSGNGIRISKVEIITKKATTTITNYCTTVAATHSVTYYRNYDENDTETSVFNCDEGTVVTAADANLFEAQTCKTFSAWNTDRDGDGTSYSAGATLTNSIDANIVLYAQWGNSPNRTVTYNVNGNTTAIASETVACGSSVTLPSASLSPLAFLGWATTEGGSVSYKAGANYEPAADVTLYAVFGSVETDDMTITTSSTGITNAYIANTKFTIGSIDFTCNDICKQGSSGSEYIQMKSTGYVYNDNNNSFGKITSIVITYNDTPRSVIVKVGTSANPTSATALTGVKDQEDENIYTFTPASGTDYGYICIGASETIKMNSIVINYEVSSSVTITNVTGTETITEPITSSDCIIVQKDAVLTLTAANNGTAANLVIEDGGQLIVTNTGVQATVKKTVANSTAKTTNKYYTISSPVNSQGIAAFVAAQGSVAHNIYRYDAANIQWQDYRIDNDNHFNFTTFTNGQGYLFRTLFNGDITYSGELNVANQSFTLSYDADNELKSFNLIGNPFSHNIYKNDVYQAEGDKPAINSNKLATGYYRINGGETFVPTIGYDNPIKPGEGVLVLATGSETLSITNTTNSAANYDGEVGAKAGNDNLMFTVANDQYEDVTYALFSKGYGLNKINHRSEYAPMLYIPQNGEDFAIAMMDDDTQAFNLNFEAKTTGRYTLSFKANGEFNYLHVIDRMTGEDVDMLLEGEYSFIGSPMDNANRFIVRLGYLPNYDDNGEDIFAYQSGSDVVVSGEGELQIFDVMGRMISAQRINGVETISLNTNGVYIFKLNEKTQKIVVR